MKQTSKDDADTTQWRGDVSDFDCAICFQLLHEPVVGNCGHDFCKSCYSQWIQRNNFSSCPICRHPLPEDLSVCLRLKNTIEKMFPEAVEERQKEIENTSISTHKRRRQSPVENMHFGVEISPLLRQEIEDLFAPNEVRAINQNRERTQRIESSVPLDWVHLPEPPFMAPVQSLQLPLPSPHRPFLTNPRSSLGYVVDMRPPPWTGNQQSINLVTSNSNPTLIPVPESTSPFFSSPMEFTMGSRSLWQSSMRINRRNRLRRVPTRFSSAFQRVPITVRDRFELPRH